MPNGPAAPANSPIVAVTASPAADRSKTEAGLPGGIVLRRTWICRG